MRLRLFLLFTFFSFVSLAQPEDATVEIVDGKRYYVHFVQAGNTLYGIHRLYNVSVEEIILANPGVEDGLATGRKLLIPIPGKEGLPENLIIHVVSAKETLYGISKKYDVSIDQLTQLNPEIESGLKEGQELKIPVKNRVGEPETKNPFRSDDDEPEERYKVSFKDTLIIHVVQKGETLYSISKRFMVTERELREVNGMRNSRIRPGDELKIPIKKESVEVVEVREITFFEKLKNFDSLFLFRRKENYKMALFMPLFYDSASMEVVSDMATHYYMGVQLALDSLEKLGLNATLTIIDTENDSMAIKKALLRPELQEVDLIFGPFFGQHTPIISKWCMENGTRLICPFATNYEVLRNNPLVYQAVTSDITLAQQLAKFMSKDKTVTDPIILVKPKSQKDLLLYEAFRSTYLADSLNPFKPKIIETSSSEFTTFLKDGGVNRIVYLTNDKGQANNLINSVNRVSVKWKGFDVRVYGTNDWVKFENIPAKYKNKFQLHFMSPYHLDYNSESLKKVHTQFRKKFGTDMGKLAVQGFDVTLLFCQNMLLQNDGNTGLMNKMYLTQKGAMNGYENTYAALLKFVNYEIVKLAELHD